MILKEIKKRKFFFFYDKFKGSGNGHQLRCQYLSQLFPKNFKLKFVNSKKNIFSKKNTNLV